ncbi:FAS1 domain-containing protein [Psidium guajava]|nr:FAS1 domain-containing protein [Psidium guajava]
MKHQFIVLSLLFLIYTTPTSAQPAASPAPPPVLPTPSPVSPPSDSPPPPAPPPVSQASILKILEKSGGFTVLVKLLRSTHVADQVNSQLADLNDGITFFAPDDTAFSALKAGTLNSLSDEQQVQLLQFHVVATYLSMSQFQTVSNPLMTKAGGTKGKEFPLNVTSKGDSVSISTGVNGASGGDYAQAPAPPRKKPVELAVSGSSEVGKVKTGDVVGLVIGIGVAGVVASLGL